MLELSNTLKHAKICDLVLYKIEVKDGDDLEDLISHAPKKKPRTAFLLSSIFPVTPSPRTINIFVKLGAGECSEFLWLGVSNKILALILWASSTTG